LILATPTAVVTAGEEPFYRTGDPLEAELAEPLGELGLVAGGELREGARKSRWSELTPRWRQVPGGVASRHGASWSATERKTAQKNVTHFPRGFQITKGLQRAMQGLLRTSDRFRHRP
jgi:hypothetical protein